MLFDAGAICCIPANAVIVLPLETDVLPNVNNAPLIFDDAIDPVILPDTVREVSVPTEVRLEAVTPLANVLPVKSDAATEAKLKLLLPSVFRN